MKKDKKALLHLSTIFTHISVVSAVAEQMGISELGKNHDKSKYSEEEFSIYEYANGKKSPHDNARDILGVSPSWIHHKARNMHHWEYWTDFNSATPNEDGTFTIICKCVKIPYDYVIEMFCDFIGAGKAYNPENWTTKSPIEYWNSKCEGQRAMHKDSEELMKLLLKTLSEKDSLEDFYVWYKDNKEKIETNYNKNML